VTESAGRVRVFALIVAAGRSRRFGSVKQLYEHDGQTMLERVIEAVVAGRPDGVVVVTRSDVSEVIRKRVGDRVVWEHNDDPAAEMIDSVRKGLVALGDAFSPSGTDGVLVCPGDLIRLTSADVARCVGACREHPDRVIVATHGGRRGHPLVFPFDLCPFVQSNACDGGLRSLPRHCADRILEVECVSVGVLHDVDRPEDLPDQ
jgi:molybdenum cofactor cytidylyltransferase